MENSKTRRFLAGTHSAAIETNICEGFHNHRLPQNGVLFFFEFSLCLSRACLGKTIGFTKTTKSGL
eukprot:COSAG06_NODE_1869_length_8172_cov_3.579143_13_plen_66_part_00